MEQKENTIAMLDLMPCPAFCVERGVIVHVNPAAAAYPLSVGMEIGGLLDTGKQEYAAFEEGNLNLTLCINRKKYNASVNRFGQQDVFILDRDPEQPELQALALAAQTLRSPLSNLMTIADQLQPAEEGDEASQDQMAKLNRGLYQMLRIVSNMSDAYLYSQKPFPRMEVRNIPGILEELFEKAAALISHAGITVSFLCSSEPVLGLVDAQQLERAVENLLANAIKFTPKGGSIAARLTRNGNMLYLTIQDSGSGITDNVRQNFCARYQRQPSLEDSRNGIGLGMVLVHSIAAAHGGTVLVQPGKDCGTRFTMTIAIRQGGENGVRSPALHVDYTGDLDHTLVEFSETLPASLYE